MEDCQDIKVSTTWTAGEKVATDPMIVANLMRYITDWEDLANCRKVNHLWNKESRSKCLSKGLATLPSIEDMEEYTEQWTGSKGYFKFKIFLYARWFETKEDRSNWEHFFKTFGSQIEELRLLISDDNLWQWIEILEALQYLKNLKTLEFYLDFEDNKLNCKHGLTYNYFGRNFSSIYGEKRLSVKTLKIKTCFLETADEWSLLFSRWLIFTFPNVEDFDHRSAAPHNPAIAINYLKEIKGNPKLIKNLREFAFAAYRDFPLDDLAELKLPLKSLRFNMPKDCSGYWLESVLSKFAPTLEHLSIIILDSSYHQKETIMPIMPKLKELHIHYPFSDQLYRSYDDEDSSDESSDSESEIEEDSRYNDFNNFSHEDDKRMVQIDLTFGNGKKLNYKRQFPVLESLVIQTGFSCKRYSTAKMREFEIYSKFFHKNAICKTVKHLKVTHPNGEGRSEKNYKRVVSRIKEAFPNVQNENVFEAAGQPTGYFWKFS